MRPDKRYTLEEAAALVPEGATLGLGGVTLYRRPIAFVLALAARYRRDDGPRNLTLLAFTAGLESDLLVGEGLVSRVRTCYFGLEAFGLAPHFTQAASQGGLEIWEESEASLAYGLRATLAGVGFMPSTAWQGTGMFQLRPDVRTVKDPYTSQQLTAFPAIRCDAAVIHALKADPEGNADIGDHRGIDIELALVADTVIVTAERVVPEVSRAQVFGPAVTAVVEAPHGAWPTSCHPDYPLDGLAILDYLEAVGTPGYEDLLAGWAEQHGLSWPA